MSNLNIFSNPNEIKITVPLNGNKKLITNQKQFAKLCGIPEATLRDNFKRLKDMVEKQESKTYNQKDKEKP